MKNRFLAITAALLLLFALVPFSVFADEGADAHIQTTEAADADAETAAEGSNAIIATKEAESTQAETAQQEPAQEENTQQESLAEEEAAETETAADTLIAGNSDSVSLITSNPSAEGYHVAIEDNARLLSTTQEQNLLVQLEELTRYGNMGIATNEEYNSDAATLARSKYIELFGETNGTLFLIDMYNRRIQIFSGGSMYRTITTAKANEITDNIYTYATNGDYYAAASNAFKQIKIVLEGGRIVTPMRYATNAAFAVGLALLINFIIITSQRKKSKASNSLTSALIHDKRAQGNSVVRGISTIMTNQKRTRHVESSGGGGGGGFSGGGGGGGGGFSGGGGGHSF